MVDVYKKPKNMYLGLYYGKEYYSRRRNNNYYRNSNKYRGYNYNYKLHNYKKWNCYKLQDEEEHKQQGVLLVDIQKETKKSVVEKEEIKEVLKNEMNKESMKKDLDKGENSKNAEKKNEHNKHRDSTIKTECKKRKAEKGNEKDEMEGREKKKEMNRKKCIIKILKRPIEVAKNDEGKEKFSAIESKNVLEGNHKTGEKKRKKKGTEKGNEKGEGKREENTKQSDIEKKNKTKKSDKNITKAKKVKEAFKFTSTQELFNLLLRDVKNHSVDEEEKKITTNNDTAAATPTDSSKLENENDIQRKIIKKGKTNSNKKSTGCANASESEKYNNFHGNSDHVQNHREGDISIGGNDQGKSTNKNKEHKSNSTRKNDKNIVAEDECTSGNNMKSVTISVTNNISLNTSDKHCTNQTKKKGLHNNNNIKENCIILKNKRIVSSTSKYHNIMNIGSNTSRGRKLLKIIKNAENGKCHYAGRKTLMEGSSSRNIPKVYDSIDYNLKYATSKYPNFTTSANLLNHVYKEELCKYNSLKNDDTRKAIKKDEEEGFFAIPIYMRSPKPEQIPIPAYLSEIVNNKEEAKDSSDHTNDNSSGNTSGDSSKTIKTKETKAHDKKTISHTRNAKEVGNENIRKENDKGSNFTNRNVEKKKKKKNIFLNKSCISFNADQNNNGKQNYDWLNAENVKNNKFYNIHSSYMKPSNYNGCNVYRSTKSFKVNKYFYNRNYKVKAYLSDNNQRGKNFNPLKELKIAVY
ncbi:hypothetical protein PGO_052170 [Plasmodium gonderi]|uniref:Uncharacterized protein n=1 Tax=Plasmodium gonderi TaxID=77519 RepID=A0A1Y1JF19_PLAGO|nr:hypothetical protein PGO_052170 [Plasmodium gonderi]GAW79807.1 hypothetical protein PGO_052170 [Plasmodium gonderi]